MIQKVNIKSILLVIGILTVVSCSDTYDTYIEPKAAFELEKTTFDLFEPVYITNTGTGESFSFWPGDEFHNYALKDTEVGNTGISPNRGSDLEYFYDRTGVYTLVVLASSYDEQEDRFVQSIDSAIITINPGNNGNDFTYFAIHNVYPGYSPEGTISGDSIMIPIGYINRAYDISDDYFVTDLINKRPPLFSVNSSTAEVYGPDGVLLEGLGDEKYETNFIDPLTYDPIVRDYTVVQDDLEHTYKVAALFYPELHNIQIFETEAIKYSLDGVTTPTEEEVRTYQLTQFDNSFYSVLVIDDGTIDFTNAIPTFEIDENSILREKSTGKVLESGVTPIDASTSPVELELVKQVNGFTITADVDLIVRIF